MASGDWRHEEWSATLGARRELGPEYEEAFVENFVERVSAEIDTRVDARLAEVTRSLPLGARRRGGTFMALASITLGIPLTAIAGHFGHLAGLAVAWGGIVLVNAAHAWRPRRPYVPNGPRRRTRP
jgi:hypothetical protein